MRIVQVTPGAGRMYCGNCLRDNALVAAYRRQGHEVLMVPMYLPITLDEVDASAGTPILFSGINVYLDQKSGWFRTAPAWLRRWLTSPALLGWTGRFAGKTRPADVAEIALSMLRGEAGNQARDLDEFMGWLRTQPRPDVICLSNALLIGMARRVRAELGVPVVCLLSGEDSFLDAMPEPQRSEVWQTLADRAREVDQFLAPSRYFADLMQRRLQLPSDQVDVVATGINLEGYPVPELDQGGARAGTEARDSVLPTQPSPLAPPVPPAVRAPAPAHPTLGYFARMSHDKGLDTLVEAFLELRRRGRVGNLRLKIGGSCGPLDQPFVDGLRTRLQAQSALAEVEFHPNLDRAAKIAFLQSLTIFSVPARYGEALGLYLIEAIAAGVPVVQPEHAAFPEVIAATGGGVLCRSEDPVALAEAVEALLLDPERRARLGAHGHRTVHERYGVERTSVEMVQHFQQVVDSFQARAGRSRPAAPAAEVPAVPR